MNISDLNYLEVQETNVVGGLGYRPFNVDMRTRYNKNVNVKEDYKLYDHKVIVADAWIWGNVATANAAAGAHGHNTDAQSYTSTYTTDYGSEAISSSISATSY